MFSSALLHLRLSAVNVGDEIVFFCWVGGGERAREGAREGLGATDGRWGGM